MAWSLDNDRPIYTQIVEKVQLQIISGFYKPGDKLPSVRELAAEAGVNPNTMQKAFMELERLELIVTLRTSGRVVTEDADKVRQIKDAVAKEQINYFLEKMKEIGFEADEIISMLTEVKEEKR